MIRTAKFNKVKYDIDIGSFDGVCDHPGNKGRPCIMLPNGLKPDKRTLVVLLHEALHACSWYASEDKVELTAEDIGAFLWKLGYRLKE